MTAEVTVVIPSFNQARFLEDAINSVLSQDVELELIIIDGGSTDGSQKIIEKYLPNLFYWQSEPDNGQASAINLGMTKGTAPFVCWLNSDDFLYPGGLRAMLDAARRNSACSFVYAKAWHVNEIGLKTVPYLTLPFSLFALRRYCFICQPATLIPRKNWEELKGLDDNLSMALDYDFWFTLNRHCGTPFYLREFVAANRMHSDTKTHNFLDLHYQESMDVVKKHTGTVPLKWFIMRPVMRLIRKLTRAYRNI